MYHFHARVVPQESERLTDSCSQFILECSSIAFAQASTE
jgi:hypothetical protein